MRSRISGFVTEFVERCTSRSGGPYTPNSRTEARAPFAATQGPSKSALDGAHTGSVALFIYRGVYSPLRKSLKRLEQPQGFAAIFCVAAGLWALSHLEGETAVAATNQTSVDQAATHTQNRATITVPSLLAARTAEADNNAALEDPRLLGEQVAAIPFALEDDVSHKTATAAQLAETQYKYSEFKLKNRETLSGLLDRAGISTQEAAEAVRALSKQTDLRKLRAGQSILIEQAHPQHKTQKQLTRLSIRDSFNSLAYAERTDAGYKSNREEIPTINLARIIEGEITDSLYLSAKRAGMPEATIVELINIMSFEVDFQRDIREGDTFRVYFKRQYAVDYDDIEEGRILHAELTLSGKTYSATYFQDENGDTDYYNELGESTRKTLMRTPVDGARLSGRFGKRHHPVLGYTRLHKGLDFAAPRGTPIKAAGDGVVERANRYGSFGNYIRIRHAGGLKTAYAHLNAFGRGVKSGTRVKQGDIIGYVGTTGRSTGPHLHYEVLRGDTQVNPFTLKTPKGKSLKGADLTAYTNVRADVMTNIGYLVEAQTFASNAPTSGNTQALNQALSMNAGY